MIVFQILTLPLCALLFVRSLLRFVRGERHRWGALVGALLWAAAGVAIIRPEITNVLASRLGIGRGTDLVVYFSAIAFLISFFYFYQKCRRLESDLTQVVRRLALDEAGERWPERDR